jgi:hypothetical protein
MSKSTTNLHGIDSITNHSADMTETAEHLSSPHSTSREQPQQRQLQPTAIQLWLKEKPHEEPWGALSRIDRQCSSTEAQELLAELEQDMARDATRR